MHISEGKSSCDKTCVENLRNSRVVYQLQSLVSSGNGAFLLGEKGTSAKTSYSLKS